MPRLNVINTSNLFEGLIRDLPGARHICDPRAIAAGCCSRCEALFDEVMWIGLDLDWFDEHGAVDLNVLMLDKALAAAREQRLDADWLAAKAAADAADALLPF